jgi:hypothetical protein
VLVVFPGEKKPPEVPSDQLVVPGGPGKPNKHRGVSGLGSRPTWTAHETTGRRLSNSTAIYEAKQVVLIFFRKRAISWWRCPITEVCTSTLCILLEQDRTYSCDSQRSRPSPCDVCYASQDSSPDCVLSCTLRSIGYRFRSTCLKYCFLSRL